MSSQIFVSVVRAWRFDDGTGRVDVTHDQGAHRRLIGQLHGAGGSNDAFHLPSTRPFSSRFWEYHLGARDYPSTPPSVLVRLLVPRRALLHVDYDHPLRTRTPIAEVFVEPFGVWTVLTVDVTGEWANDRAVADALDDALHTDVTRDSRPLGRVRVGIDKGAVETALSPVPWGDIPRLIDAGTLTLVSGLSPAEADVPAVKERAARFRTQFTGSAGGTTHRLTQSTGAASTTTTQIGITLADTSRRSPARIKCLHHNHALLAGHLLTFGELMRAQPVAQAAVYQERAARVLNHLHRGEPLAGAGIYKSRVAPAWIEAAGLITPINDVTARFATDLVPALSPAPPPPR